MNLDKVDLNLLVALDALLDERHVGRAAERLHVSQPTMSLALGKLRRHFGDELLVREGGGMAPTALAEQLQPRVRRFVIEARELVGLGLAFEPATSDRRFTLVCSEPHARLYVPGVLRRMREEAPGVALSCQPVSELSIRRFNEGSADLLFISTGPWAIADDRAWLERHDSEVLAEEKPVCVSAAALGLPDVLTADDIARLEFVAPTFAGMDFRPAAERPLAALYGAEVRVVAETPHTAVATTVSRSSLVAILSERVARQEAQRLDLRISRLPDVMSTPVPYTLLWHRRSASDPAVQWLRALFKAEVAAFGD